MAPRFAAQARATLRDLQSSVSDDWPAARDRMFTAAHNIKGQAATFGYAGLGRAASQLCAELEGAARQPRVASHIATCLKLAAGTTRSKSRSR